MFFVLFRFAHNINITLCNIAWKSYCTVVNCVFFVWYYFFFFVGPLKLWLYVWRILGSAEVKVTIVTLCNVIIRILRVRIIVFRIAVLLLFFSAFHLSRLVTIFLNNYNIIRWDVVPQLGILLNPCKYIYIHVYTSALPPQPSNVLYCNIIIFFSYRVLLLNAIFLLFEK